MDPPFNSTNPPAHTIPNPKTAAVTIPPSPALKKLGWGTGVSVYCFPRSKEKSCPISTPKTPSNRLAVLKGGNVGSSPWAVKKVNRAAPEIVVERLREEAQVLRTLNHPNIVGFRQVTTSCDGRIEMAMEFGGEGSLYDKIEARLEASDMRPFDSIEVYRVGQGVSHALAYLHHEMRILHGDVKSANVLVFGKDFSSVKLCDFGVCQRLDENLEMTDEDAEYVGTELWFAKEVLDGGVVSNKTDIFAFGLTLWEMWTLKAPHLDDVNEEDESVICLIDSTTDSESSFSLPSVNKRAPGVGTRPPVPEWLAKDVTTASLLHVFLQCTEEDAPNRPSAEQLVKVFGCMNLN